MIDRAIHRMDLNRNWGNWNHIPDVSSILRKDFGC